MRSVGLALVLCFCAARISAQQRQQQDVTIRLDFDTGAENAGSEMLAVLPISRAWSDSVSVFFNDQLRQRAPQNLVRAQNDPAPNYRLWIQPLPIMSTDNKPVGTTVYGIVMFRPLRGGYSWEYVASSVGYNRSAKDAAGEILDWTVALLRR